MEELLTTVFSAGPLSGLSCLSKETPIYSPTEVQDWSRCSLYRQYKGRWTMRGDDWTPNMTMGTALDAAMKAWWLGNDAVPTPEQAGLDILEQAYQDQPDWTLEELKNIYQKGLKIAIKGKANQPGWEYWKEREELVQASSHLRGVDQPGALIVNGKYVGTPDLVTRKLTNGRLVVRDLKTSLNLKSEWIPKRISETEVNHQAWQYAYFVSLVYSELVEEVQFQYVGLYPTITNTVAIVAITPERLNLWLQDTEIKWSRMRNEEEADFYPGNWENCYGKYGKCAYFPICHELDRDESRIRTFYDEVKSGN